MAEIAFVKVAELGELSPGNLKMVEVGDDQILLANVAGNIYACDNVCTHAFAPLSEGGLDEEQVECPLHGSVFNVATGEVIDPPAVENLRVFQVRIEGQDILVGPPTG
ncbi:MAG: non-heme iron oxygenase ferredoxin subunit [Chloroflexi bacterium]|nr:non-heme iron oxygenase ferredoxin subunit [Chloroflexota bacterium]